jgi:hypothetical protein
LSDSVRSKPTATGRAARLTAGGTGAALRTRTVAPAISGWRAIALFGAIICCVAGCGGAPKPTTRTFQGAGYVFDAPAPWTVTSTSSSQSASSGPVDRVEVFTFALEHPYRLALFPQAARELDRVAAKLALELRARISAKATIRVAGRLARSYRLVYRTDRVQEIVFVLRGQSEYELFCRRLVSDPDAPCTELVESFAFVGKP